ncbi:MAG: nickel pincer cofactor biosynthesis protein LarC [Clostridia bacterium]|nr:nickel pincer cofactor biosynthesis protein LarC [Clostridia bacterium]
MSILYLDCSMGAAGDMLAASLLGLIPNKEDILSEINSLFDGMASVSAEKAVKCGITGTHFSVLAQGIEEDENIHAHGHHHNDDDHYHQHTSISYIKQLVNSFDIDSRIKDDIISVYDLIAHAESNIHGTDIENIHFHEVGSIDAVADITAVCLLINKISPDYIMASPVCTGSGQVICAHGILPVPAPATADILRGIPVYSGEIKSELCTPTGAALLKHFVSKFGEMPVMTVNAVGYGMGKKDFPVANCVRSFIGEENGKTDKIIELSCNVDDMTGEEISFAVEKFFENGCPEAYTIPINMKKGRPGTLIKVICKAEDRDKFVSLIFKHTTTIGIRESGFNRYVLNREIKTLRSDLGEIRVKCSEGYGSVKYKPEYDDIARIANENGMSLAQVKEALNKADKW